MTIILGFNKQSGQPRVIHSVDEWLNYAPPKKRDAHWKPEHSAKELARAWFRTGRPQMPDELHSLLQSQPALQNFQADVALPEWETKLDNFRGEGRNHDLLLLGYAGERSTLVGIEAKVDEPFGDEIGKCLKRGEAKKGSKIPDRINGLVYQVFGREVDDAIRGLRYQLLTALAGTISEANAQGCKQAVFVVHELIPHSTDSKHRNVNAHHFDKFVQVLTGEP